MMQKKVGKCKIEILKDKKKERIENIERETVMKKLKIKEITKSRVGKIKESNQSIDKQQCNTLTSQRHKKNDMRNKLCFMEIENTIRKLKQTKKNIKKRT